MAATSEREKPVDVAAAVVMKDGRLLICRRAPGGSCGGLWEFPGGKIEPGETPEACAARECMEELRVTVRPAELILETRYRYPDRTVHLFFYRAVLEKGAPVRTVQRQVRWVRPERLNDYPFCPADACLIRRLQSLSESGPA